MVHTDTVINYCRAVKYKTWLKERHLKKADKRGPYNGPKGRMTRADYELWGDDPARSFWGTNR